MVACHGRGDEPRASGNQWKDQKVQKGHSILLDNHENLPVDFKYHSCKEEGSVLLPYSSLL